MKKPRAIWTQHADILAAMSVGDGDAAEALALSHITQAARFMVARLLKQPAEPAKNAATSSAFQG